MDSKVKVVFIIVSVILGNILCAEVANNRNTHQNPWQRLNTSSPNYYTEGNNSTTPWPVLGRPRNQPNNFQPTSRTPQWVRPNNGPNWVRNTPLSQNTYSSQNYNLSIPNFHQNSRPQQNIARSQNGNTLFLNNERNAFGSNGFNNNYANNNKGNVGYNQRGENGNYPRSNNEVNNMISAGSVLTGSENVGNQVASSSDVGDEELRQFSEELLNKDVNNAAQYVTVNLQGMTSSRSTRDEAPLPLLTINQQAYSVPSISKLIPLYNNYIVESNQNEVYTAQEKNEENDLLSAVLQTPVMQHTRNFLISKGKLGRDPQEFKDLLRLIWFNMYSRGGGRIGSSGFEHVFLTELKNNQVSGLHNWLYFYEEEQKHNANYLGYMKKIDLGSKGFILKFHFTFQGVDKPVGSMFIGTSPELEMALYSTCFILRADKICPLKMNGRRFIIRTYTYRYRGKSMIGSAFPEI